MNRSASPLRIPVARPAPSTTIALPAASKSKFNRAISNVFGAVGALFAAIVVDCPADTATVCPAPRTLTVPSVVLISVTPAATATWNAVPRTLAVALEVTTSYFAVGGNA